MPDQSQPAPPQLQDRTVTLSLKGAKTIGQFLKERRSTELSLTQCRQIVEAVIRSLDGLYVHLPVKRALYAVDPVRRLQLLKLRLDRLCKAEARLTSGDKPEPELVEFPTGDLWFFRELIDTLTSVRDLHTAYVLPPPFETAIAFVPFQIEAYFDERQTRRYVVTNVFEGLNWFPIQDSMGFGRGVEVTHWNDIPIERAVELAGARNPGGNPSAKLARGLARLTIRPLSRSLPPDEEWVTLHYRNGQEPVRSLRVEWRVAVLDKIGSELPLDGERIRPQGLDHETDTIRMVRKFMYSPRYRDARRRIGVSAKPSAPPGGSRRLTIGEPVAVPERLQDICEAQTLQFDGEALGYIHLRSFLGDPDTFRDDFQSVLTRLPERGLILDIRGNPGGVVQNSEGLLQLFTPRTIEPAIAQFINTPLSIEVSSLLDDQYKDWTPSMREAQETGATFSNGFPLTARSDCNQDGQRYYGPVILITDALCYSAADIFAAGFLDNQVGDILAIDGTTGAGGADVVLLSVLCGQLEGVLDGTAAPLTKLPAGDLRLAFRRILRVGPQSGSVLEDIGVASKLVHRLTRDDVLQTNVDLLQAAAERLVAKPGYLLREKAGSLKFDGNTVTVTVETRNIDRLDVAFSDGWVDSSKSLSRGQTIGLTARRGPGSDAKYLILRGYAGNELSAARKLFLLSS